MADARNGQTAKSTKIYGDYLLMLAAPCALSIWYYGAAALRTLAVCVLTAFVCDFVAGIIVNKQYYAADLSGICTGIIIAMMLPADVPVYIGMTAASFAILAAKIPFGGGMRTPFVPAAAGFAFAAVCFKEQIFTYGSGRAFMKSVSLGSSLVSGNTVRLTASNFLDILTGNIYGPMGTTCVIAMLGCVVFLVIRRRQSLIPSAGFLGACLLVSLIFPRSEGSVISCAIMELCSGSLLFAAVFMLTNPATMPVHRANKVVYGVFTGIVCMTMRKLGAFEEPVCFAVLIANAFSPLLDMLTDRARIIVSTRQKAREVKANG
ncbi:MAG: RnfABCDGE type electron transport complex subunit D [Clostridia bacterium]|nr:RnfABCDGE type electron transport complex subunit D [Clostridia bacterium]